jgi:hypothetical protein
MRLPKFSQGSAFPHHALSVTGVCVVLQVFEQGQMRGYWRMSYCDAGFRVFYTNKGNLFVLRRLDKA